MGLKKEIKREIVGASYFRKILALPQAVREARAIATGNVSHLHSANGKSHCPIPEQPSIKQKIAQLERDRKTAERLTAILNQRSARIHASDQQPIHLDITNATPKFVVEKINKERATRLDEEGDALYMKLYRSIHS